MKNLLKQVVPEPARRWWRRVRGPRLYHGNYASWAEVPADAKGYDDHAVLARVCAAARDVRAGRAAWDRDGVTFPNPMSNAPLLTALRAVAVAEGGRLDLVDFGGALGSTWWQHRLALADLGGVRWQVVERADFIAAGREFADQVLGFHATIEAALGAYPPRTILLSSVLPYLEHPYELLAEVVRRGFRHIIIDRTSFAADGRERLVVQHASPELGGGRYPCWVFSRSRLLESLGPEYALVAEWPGFDEVDPAVNYRGFHFQRTHPPHAA